MSEGAGPFSMMAIAVLENHVKEITFAGKKYAAMQVPGLDGNLTPIMVFCRGVLGYNDHQELTLGIHNHREPVQPGDWIVMVSQVEYVIMRLGEGSLFDLMPQVPICTEADRLSRIAEAHKKDVDGAGGTHGVCVECYQAWDEKTGGCPTRVWATKARDPLATWDPADDETETPEGVEHE